MLDASCRFKLRQAKLLLPRGWTRRTSDTSPGIPPTYSRRHVLTAWGLVACVRACNDAICSSATRKHNR